MPWYHVTLSCSGLTETEGSAGAPMVEAGFRERPWHHNVACRWDGSRLWIEAGNDYDADGRALFDEFWDEVFANISFSGSLNFEIVSVKPNPPATVWLPPWHAMEDPAVGKEVSAELYRELCQQHVLYGIKVRSIGRRQDCDDYLFELLDGSGRFAVVHLTFGQHPEPNPLWPSTEIYQNWTQFERERMQRDATEEAS